MAQYAFHQRAILRTSSRVFTGGHQDHLLHSLAGSQPEALQLDGWTYSVNAASQAEMLQHYVDHLELMWSR